MYYVHVIITEMGSPDGVPMCPGLAENECCFPHLCQFGQGIVGTSTYLAIINGERPTRTDPGPEISRTSWGLWLGVFRIPLESFGKIQPRCSTIDFLNYTDSRDFSH